MADDNSHVPPDGIAPGAPPPGAPPGGIFPGAPREPVVRPAETSPHPPRDRSTAGSTAPQPGKSAPPQEVKDGFREVIETIVFVVVLVLLLKTFLAEAFVIPTGSMATTLLGYHREVTCQKCGYPFLVNASSEADPQEFRPQAVESCVCPNCSFHNRLRPPAFGGPR
jgi:signal peptidase I